MRLGSTAFVIVPLESPYGIVFGKNSNKPADEVQELIYEPARDVDSDIIKCTHIAVPAKEKTFAVILSKATWSWGCEMGANDQGVVGGLIPVPTKVEQSETPGLIGVDLLRLALERSSSASEAVDTIGALLTEFGQGGCREQTDDGVLCDSAFVLVDQNGVWLMETAGKVWVAKSLPQGARSITSRLSIGSDYEKNAADLETVARDSGFWNGEGKLVWNECFGKAIDGEDKHSGAVDQVIQKMFDENKSFGVKDMMKVLRDKESKICRTAGDVYPTVGSQISILPKKGPCCHWFTATPDPSLSVFKPFIFTPNARVSHHTKSSDGKEHNLYRLHAKATASGDNKVISLLQDMETNCLAEVESFIFDFQPGQSLSETDDLLKDIVETEVKFY